MDGGVHGNNEMCMEWGEEPGGALNNAPDNVRSFAMLMLRGSCIQESTLNDPPVRAKMRNKIDEKQNKTEN